MAKGRFDEAIDCFTQALRAQSDYAEAHNNLGYVLAVRGQVADGLTHFAQALALNPHYFDAHFNMARWLASRQPRLVFRDDSG